MPYLYSLGKHTYDTGAPFMRALFMDFPDDPRVFGIADEYMFGPAFLVAPVTEQGAQSREIYLPAGGDWYDYWTNEMLPGGRTITVAAPIGTIPLFVRAGSIIPLGVDIASTATAQALAEIRVYPGRDAQFALYDDDGVTYDYETGRGRTTHLLWDDRSGRFTATGDGAAHAAAGLVRIIR
jgi:alpha-D-xyloside xylohydrolase